MISKDNFFKNRLLTKNIFSFFNNLIVKQISIGLIFSALLFLIIINNIVPERISIKVGDFASDDIRATRDIIDEEATNKLKLEAINKVESRYTLDLSIHVNIKNEIDKFFDLIYSIKDNEGTDLGFNLRFIKNQTNIELSEDELLQLIKSDTEALEKLENNIYDIVDSIMTPGLEAEAFENEKKNIKTIFSNLEDISESLKNIGERIVTTTIKPNRFFDVETTKQKRDEAASEIQPVIIKKGQIIVSKGEQVDYKTLELIRKTGLLKDKDQIDYKIVIGSLITVLITISIIIAYLYFLNKEILENMKQLTLLVIIILSIIIISDSLYSISAYVIPVSTAAMLVSILVNPKLAVLINIIIALIIGLITGNDINIVTMCILGGTVGAIGVVKTNQRYSIFVAGLVVGAANVLTIASFGLISEIELSVLLSKIFFGMINGLFSAILTIGSLPLWEGLFGIVTPQKLLELSNPNQPLLKKLLLEAPGTYHHSIIVGNLSEAASEAINGNPLLARVGAYYHDVGKLKRPYFFKENQLNGVNPHDKLNPSLSTLIITNHVKDGVEMAKKYKLPIVIENIIREHHGKTLVAYFYHKAINGENPDLIQEESFRYEGPKPQSKEAAIIILADSVEAAVRSIQEPTRGKIEGLVRQIIKDKLADGQLDECSLTLRDLDTIANSFLNVLYGIFHERIEYPKLDLSELKGVN